MLNLEQTKQGGKQQGQNKGPAVKPEAKNASKKASKEGAKEGAAEETPEPPKEENAPAPKQLTLDRSAPHFIVRGEPGVTYQQRGNFFDRSGRFVRGSKYRIRQEAKPEAKTKEGKLIHRAVKMLGGKEKTVTSEVPDVPKAVKDAQKENAQAEAAENSAPAE